jgi:hypothetical protein
MKRFVASLLCGLAVALLSGCILLPVPHEQWVSPRFHGVVRDADTGKPVAGVQIALRGYHYAEADIGPVVVRSDESGRYSVVASRHSNWLPIWLGPAEGTQQGIVTFELEGYTKAEERRSRFTGAMSRVEFEVDVRLKRKEPNQTPEPTPTSVTPRADARVAPAAVVAHL